MPDNARDLSLGTRTTQSVLLACGHSANAVAPDGAPCCAICFGLAAGASTIVDAPDLSGRTARCDCGHSESSRLDLAFFRHWPDRDLDSFYCGHAGWD